MCLIFYTAKLLNILLLYNETLVPVRYSILVYILLFWVLDRRPSLTVLRASVWFLILTHKNVFFQHAS